MNPTHALIVDGDYVVFQALAAAEHESDWGDGIWTLECDHNKAWDIVVNTLAAIRSKRKAWDTSKMVLCFTDTVNWRKDVLPTYKANRKATRKPLGYHAFVDRVINHTEWTCFLRPTLEGDDCMGILATAPRLVGCTSATICSPDKDFKTIPCEFFYMTTGEILQQSQEDADRWHMYQTMIGDTTDGYGGIKGIGEETANEFLDNPYIWEQYEHTFKSGARKGTTELRWRKAELPEGMSLWDAMVTVAAKQGMTEEELLVQAQVARICRHCDYDFKNKEVILWTPAVR